ncbi:KAP family NTPase, partial [Litoreibacter sp.]|nr:KAP family NTPase [Litoreibacter sp.]
MGTGSGGLTLSASAHYIVNAVLAANFSSLRTPVKGLRPEPSRVYLAAPHSTEMEELHSMEDTLRNYLATSTENQKQADQTNAPSASDTPPSSADAPPPRRATGTKLNEDHPVNDIQGDLLGRKAIGEAVADNVRRAWGDGDNTRPFIVHLSGRWGSGKSTILNFIEHYLITPPTVKDPQKQINRDPWIVINYNAWQQQAEGRAWWSLLNAVSSGVPQDLSGTEKWWFWLSDKRWRITAQFRTLIIGFVIFLALLGYFGFKSNGTVSEDGLPFGTTLTTTETRAQDLPEVKLGEVVRPAGTLVERRETVERGAKTKTIWDNVVELKELIVLGLALLTAFGGFFVRRQKTEAMLKDLSLDPTEPLRKRYAKMINDLDRPVAVLIDDLDRCDAAFVIEILQAAQNIYSDVPVLYVVASDKDWIVSAYEQSYAKFSEHVSRPGRPLGHLFVEKIFQLSVNVPDLGETERDAYLGELVGRNDLAGSLTDTEQIETLKQDLEAAEGDVTEIRTAIGKVSSPAAHQEASLLGYRAILSAKAEAAITHYLEDYLPLMDPNPRAIKRVVNAFQFLQGYAILAGKEVRIEALVLWAILDLRFPYATRRLHRNPLRWSMEDKEKYYSSPVIK